MKNYVYEGVLPPRVFQSAIDGKCYILPAWIEVEQGTTLDQVTWVKPDYLNKVNPNDPIFSTKRI